ncbi:MAG: hypothetical protein HQL27_02015 [Candidatus Omnitrophica bacterium]|nr:hypothetical protein [Candidatus Omnitrophota bacterium]
MQTRQRNQVISAVSGVLGFILIAFILLRLYSQTRFLKYENLTDGYSIDYPSGWTYTEDTNNTSAIFLSPKEYEFDLFQENVNIVIQDLSKNPKSLKDYTQLAIVQLQAVFQQNINIVESSEIFWGGNPSHRLVFTAKGDQFDLKFMNIWTIEGNRAYQFTYAATLPKYNDYLKKVKKMANSFNIR